MIGLLSGRGCRASTPQSVGASTGLRRSARGIEPGRAAACFTQPSSAPRRAGRPRRCRSSARPCCAQCRRAGRPERRAVEERHLHVFGEDMKRQEPAVALDAIERRVPPHRLPHVRDGPHDQRVEALAEAAFPARHRRDIGLHRCVAVTFRDLRVAAREENDGPRRVAPSAVPCFASFRGQRLGSSAGDRR